MLDQALVVQLSENKRMFNFGSYLDLLITSVITPHLMRIYPTGVRERWRSGSQQNGQISGKFITWRCGRLMRLGKWSPESGRLGKKGEERNATYGDISLFRELLFVCQVRGKIFTFLNSIHPISNKLLSIYFW
jgi:hypothetical protein